MDICRMLLNDSDETFTLSEIIREKQKPFFLQSNQQKPSIANYYKSIHLIMMNHVIQLNKNRYLIRQYQQKIEILTFPHFHLVQKHYINASSSYLNRDTHQLLVLYQNQLTVMRPALMPLQFVVAHQSFIEWEPLGGILLANAIVLYGLHCIVFYNRSALVEKSWEIDIVQDIECIKSTPSGDCLAMKVKSPDNSLVLWNTGDPSIKPSQEIILTQSIIAWEFVSAEVLTILTAQELRIYRKDLQTTQYNLYHFYQLAARTFAWVGLGGAVSATKQSISTLILLGRQGECSIVELMGVQKRTEKSELKELGKLRLHYKDINMRRVLSAWGENGKLALVCQTKNHSVFCFLLSSTLKIQYELAYEDLLGADINSVSCLKDTVLARDRSRWKLFSLSDKSNLTMLDQVDCEKAFVLSEDSMLCLDKQTIFARKKGVNADAVAFKYPNADRVQYIGHSNDTFYFVAGIRFYRFGSEGVVASGFALKNQKAVIIQANPFTKSLLYRVGEQYLLLSYRIDNQKVTASTLKSSSTACCALTGGYWAQKWQQEIKVGNGDKLLAAFAINRLLKILDCENQIFEYTIAPIYGSGFIIVIKNYAFFLQLVQDQKGYDIVILKRLNTLLFRRFSPQSHTIQLIQPNTLTFWVGNSVRRVGSRVNQYVVNDPFSLPETLLAKQLDLRKVYPPHHPRLLLALIESNRFQLLFQSLHAIYKWFQCGKPISELYHALSVEFLSNCEASKEDSLSLLPQHRLQEQQAFLKKFSQQILESSDKIQLKQKNPLIFESILSSLAAVLANSKSVDYFSQNIMLLLKTPLRPRSFSSMQIVLLSHSLNKEEALAQLKNDKSTINWDWVRNLALPFWYDNREELKKIIEEVAANEYRAKKDPFDCLFWYLLVGKRSLISTLFKNHKLNSKEHQATGNFLLRDFNQPKDKSAAVKNAYVLIDKKRYFHAMSFFILGGAIDDCVRICIDRLRDLSLAFTFVLLFKEASNTYLFGQMNKGDIWMRHLVNKLSSQHIKSYNALFQSTETGEWNYTPELASFHPILPQFSAKIKGSIGVRRQLDAQNTKVSASQDIFADFYGEESSTTVQQETTKVQLQGDPDSLRDNVVKYYLRQGLPVLALLENPSIQQAQQNYSYQRYKLSGEVDPSMQQTIANLQDKAGYAQCLLAANKQSELLHFLATLSKEFANVFQEFHLEIVIQTKKHCLGELMRLGHQSQLLLKLLKSKAMMWGDRIEQIQQAMKRLRQYATISKILSALLLRNYEDIVSLLQSLGQNAEDSDIQDFWSRLKSGYDRFSDVKKEKSVKQMDHFQHAFIAVRRRAEEQQPLRSEMQISRQEAALLLLRVIVLQYFIKLDLPLRQEISSASRELNRILSHWLPQEQLLDIIHEYKLLIKEGSQSKLKLNLLKTVFDEEFISVYDIVAMTHLGYFQEKHAGNAVVQAATDLQGIEVFRNRQDGLRGFTINQYESRGLECIVMFKRGLKKFQLCENLANRERSKEGIALMTEDSFYTSLSNSDPHAIQRGKYHENIQKALTHILENKKEGQFPRGQAPISGKEFLRQIDPPYLNYNELNSIECHPFLPFFLIGGKGNVELAHLSSLKNFDRIKCPEVGEIVRLHSCGQRVGVSDLAGNLGLHVFDSKYINSCVFSLKKAGVIDFCYMKPSVLTVLTSSAVQVYDTLLHPKRQLKFKQPFTKDPLSVSAISDTRLAVLRKNQVLIYDIRMQKLECSKELKGKGKSMLTQGKWIYVGQSDCNVRVFSSVGDEAETIRLGVQDQKDREKVGVEQLRNFNDIVLASTSQGSIYYLPKFR